MYPEDSEIKFKISHFPDGQSDVTIEEIRRLSMVDGEYKPLEIKSRFNSFKDLELIICATKALRRIGVNSIHLYIPYLLGARSDRQFQEGGTSYLVDVIAPIINSLNFKTVTVMDVHSDVAAACINNLKVISNVNLVRDSIADIQKNIKADFNTNFNVWISPDAGALKKIYKLADQLGYKDKIYTATKSRAVDGSLSNQSIPDYQNDRFKHMNKDVIIIDDICDGGATFINLGKIIKNGRHQKCTGKTYLIVTHGIFSKLFKELFLYFDGIYTTDSIRSDFDWEQKERDKTEICKIIRI